jgi:hypothetical protein
MCRIERQAHGCELQALLLWAQMTDRFAERALGLPEAVKAGSSERRVDRGGGWLGGHGDSFRYTIPPYGINTSFLRTTQLKSVQVATV